jgi:predicted nucleotidyltransferase
MSRPIEFYDIETGRLNDPERFNRALELARQGFQNLYDEARIRGALIFGSAVFGDAEALSDLDAILLLSEVRRSEDNELIRDLARTTFKETGVPLELSCFSHDEFYYGRHPYRPHVVTWLREQAELYPENVIGDPRLKDIRAGEVNLAADLNNWLESEQYRLGKQDFQGHNFRPEDLLAYVLNTPHVAGRKCIDVLRWTGTIPEDVLLSMRKTDIASAVHEVLAGDRAYFLWDLYEQLSHDRDDFANFVACLAPDQLDAEEFRQIVCETLKYDLPIAKRLLGWLQIGFNDAYLHYGGMKYPENQPRRAEISKWLMM